MGLDWLPGNKPKPGHEAECEALVRKISEPEAASSGLFFWKNKKAGMTEEEREAAKARFFEISITAFETLDAPQVGHDAAATEWARKRVREKYPDMADADVQAATEEIEGHYVLDLVPPCDGIPIYSNGSLGYVESYSFRADFLKGCTGIIGDDLLERGFSNMVSAEFLDYGRTLIRKAEECAAANGLDIHNLAFDDDDDESLEFQIHVVLSAGRWCVFWAERGHILDPYW